VPIIVQHRRIERNPGIFLRGANESSDVCVGRFRIDADAAFSGEEHAFPEEKRRVYRGEVKKNVI